MVTQGQRLNFLLSALLLLLAACSSQSPQQAQRAAEQRQFLERQLTELDALAVPEGVSPGTWAELKAGLAVAIEGRLAGAPAKAASAAPTSDAARMKLLFDFEASTFTWRYYNPGDYDQNGEVNISDLTPLAVHLNKAVPAGPDGANSIEAVVDGDGNGQVNISDLTPLGANLGRRVTQLNLYASADPTALPIGNGGPSLIPATDSVLMSAALGQSNLERLHFSYPSAPLLVDHYYWLRPADGSTGAEGTSSTLVQAGNFSWPTASLQATPFQGAAPLNVVLDASESTGASEYQFDPEGDGSFISTGLVESFGHLYESAGTYNATLRVIGNNGLIRSAGIVVNAGGAAQWYRYTLPAYDIVRTPRGLALTEHAGVPHVFVNSQREVTSLFDMGYYVANGPVGNDWANWRQIIGTGAEQARLSVEKVSSRLALAYAGSGWMFYRRSVQESLFGGWEQALDLNHAAQTHEWFSLKFIDGRAMLAYHDPVADNFEFLCSNGTLGDAWFPVEIPVADTSQGEGVSMAEIGGVPAIAYYDRGGFGALEYTRAQDDQGFAWNAPVQITLGNFRMFDTLLTLADGAPGIVAHNYTDDQVRFYRAASAAGNWNGSAVLAQTNGSLQCIPRAVMVGNIPHAFWVDTATARLMHAAADDEEALSWSEAEVVAGNVSAEVLPAPADVNGMPAVAFVDNSANIRYAVYY